MEIDGFRALVAVGAQMGSNRAFGQCKLMVLGLWPPWAPNWAQAEHFGNENCRFWGSGRPGCPNGLKQDILAMKIDGFEVLGALGH